MGARLPHYSSPTESGLQISGVMVLAALMIPFLSNHMELQMFHALTNRSFRRLWADAWLWYVSAWMAPTVLSWLVLERTDSPSQVALVGVSRTAPVFLLGLMAGALADRYPKKWVITSAHTVNLTASLVMMVVLFAGRVQPWHVFVYIFIAGTAWTADWSARQSYYSEIFEGTRLANAVSLDIAALQGGSMIGPFLGGGLIALVGYGGTFAVMAAILLVRFPLLLSLTCDVPRAPMSTGSLATQLVEAVRVVRANRTMWAILAVTVSLNLFGVPYTQVVPVIARDVLQVGPALYGALAGAAGLGGLSGALVIASRQVQRQGILFSVAGMLTLAALFFFALSSVYSLSLVLLFVAGAGLSGFATMQSTIALQAVAPRFRGRVMGTVAFAVGAMPLGMFLLGQLTEAIGVQMALALFAAIGFLTLNMLRWRFPELCDQAASRSKSGW